MNPSGAGTMSYSSLYPLKWQAQSLVPGGWLMKVSWANYWRQVSLGIRCVLLIFSDDCQGQPWFFLGSVYSFLFSTIFLKVCTWLFIQHGIKSKDRARLSSALFTLDLRKAYSAYSLLINKVLIQKGLRYWGGNRLVQTR